MALYFAHFLIISISLAREHQESQDGCAIIRFDLDVSKMKNNVFALHLK